MKVRKMKMMKMMMMIMKGNDYNNGKWTHILLSQMSITIAWYFENYMVAHRM
jgi:hypothetical protein